MRLIYHKTKQTNEHLSASEEMRTGSFKNATGNLFIYKSFVFGTRIKKDLELIEQQGLIYYKTEHIKKLYRLILHLNIIP